MDKKQLQQNIVYLIEKYISNRENLKILIKEDIGSVKYILSEIEKDKDKDYTDEDLKLIQDIVFYYV